MRAGFSLGPGTAARRRRSVPGTKAYLFDLMAEVPHENSMSAISVPGTEGYGVDNITDEAAR